MSLSGIDSGNLRTIYVQSGNGYLPDPDILVNVELVFAQFFFSVSFIFSSFLFFFFVFFCYKRKKKTSGIEIETGSLDWGDRKAGILKMSEFSEREVGSKEKNKKSERKTIKKKEREKRNWEKKRKKNEYGASCEFWLQRSKRARSYNRPSQPRMRTTKVRRTIGATQTYRLLLLLLRFIYARFSPFF